MFNQLVKWTIIVGMWRKYKRHFVATCVLLLCLVLINYIHLDYLEFAIATGSKSLGFSYLIKWSGFILAIVFYLLHLKRVNNSAQYDSRLHKMMRVKPVVAKKEDKKTHAADDEASNTDPFANIRTKKKLRSEADFLIEKDE